MLRVHRTATVEAVPVRTRSHERHVSAAERVIAPLCIVAAGAAFAAEVIVGSDAATFGALSVVPVLAASLLRSRLLTLMVAAFAMLLQVWGAGLGVVSRNAAGMQISVYLLTLAVAALQQSRSPLSVLEQAAPDAAVAEREATPAPPPAIQVTGVAVPAPKLLAPELPSLLADALTRREREVVQLAAQGCTAREIGSLLFIGERTVETHLGNAYGKLGVRSKVELARLVTTSAEDHADLRTRTEATERISA